MAGGPLGGGDRPVDEQAIVRITDEDVANIEQVIMHARQVNTLRLSPEEIDSFVLQNSVSPLTITLEDLARLGDQINGIDTARLAPLIKISLEEIPHDLNFITTDCYHGTSRQAAEKIRREGFLVGNGTGLGAGIYFSVGGVTLARGYVKTSEPCIIKARVDWGKVAYLDDPTIPASIKSAQSDQKTENALGLGYNSFLSSRDFSTDKPAVGVVLAKRGTYVRRPRIEVVELIDPSKLP